MDWLPYVQKALEYIEADLLNIKTPEDVAQQINMSDVQLQKGFHVLTGYNVGEYIKNRKLYLAGKDILQEKNRIIDVAFKYGYDTPESFSRAFSRFHHVSPQKIKKNPNKLKVFVPVKIDCLNLGGFNKGYSIDIKFPIKLIGFQRTISKIREFEEIEAFWNEFNNTIGKNVFDGKEPQDDIELAIINNNIGEFGVCSEIDDEYLSYYIAGRYTGGSIPHQMSLFCFEGGKCASFMFNEHLKEVEIANFTEEFKDRELELGLATNVRVEKFSNHGGGKINSMNEAWFRIDKKMNNGTTEKRNSISLIIVSLVSVLLLGLVIGGITANVIANTKIDNIIKKYNENFYEIAEMYENNYDEFCELYGDDIEIKILPEKNTEEKNVEEYINELNDILNEGIVK